MLSSLVKISLCLMTVLLVCSGCTEAKSLKTAKIKPADSLDESNQEATQETSDFNPDLNGDCNVDGDDLSLFLGAETTEGGDLGILLEAWGLVENCENDPDTTPNPDPTPTGPNLSPGDGFKGQWSFNSAGVLVNELGDEIKDAQGNQIKRFVTSATAKACDAQVIARWNVVPHQTLSEDFQIGVPAFFYHGIEKVVFFAEGADHPIDVTKSTWNPRTEVSEYNVTFSPQKFIDKKTEFRAVAIPKVCGEVRLLSGPQLFHDHEHFKGEMSLFLYSNAGGSYETKVVNVGTNVQTPDIQDYQVVYLSEGTHDLKSFEFLEEDPTGDRRYTTVSGAPGTDPSKVILTVSRDRKAAFRLRNLTFLHAKVKILEDDNLLWADGVHFIGLGRTETFADARNSKTLDSPTGKSGVFITNSKFEGKRFGIFGAELLRNVEFTKQGDDAIREFVGVASNIKMHDISSPDGGQTHTDMIQWYTSKEGVSQGRNPRFENILVYNIEATNCEGFFPIFSTNNDLDPEFPMSRDIAFVNLFSTCVGSRGFYIVDDINHFILSNATIAYPSTGDPTATSTGMSLGEFEVPTENFLVRDSYLTSLRIGKGLLESGEVQMINTHFRGGAELSVVRDRDGNIVRDSKGTPLLDAEKISNYDVLDESVTSSFREYSNFDMNQLEKDNEALFLDWTGVFSMIEDFGPNSDGLLKQRPHSITPFVTHDIRGQEKDLLQPAIGAFE